MPFKLTDTAIRTAKPKDKIYKLADGEGLYIEVAPSGGKRWRAKYRFGGKEKRLSLGVYPTVGLREARQKLAELKELLHKGIDPSEERKAVREETANQGVTFAKVALEWYAKRKAALTEKHAAQVLSRLENHIFPHIGNKPIASLKPQDFLLPAQQAERLGHVETAHRLMQICSQVTSYARLVGIVEVDAASGLSKALAQTVTKHHAAITDPAEVGTLLRAIDDYPGGLITRYALKIMPYVFVRSSELRGSGWQEIDLDKATWIIPAERMKMRQPHIVPLAPQVVDLFSELWKFTGRGELVFSSAFSNTRCITDMGLLNALRRMGYERGVMTIHGFRGMASTLLNELGFRPDVIEAQLAHAEGNAVRAAYNHAEYLAERRKMMCAWADYLDGLRAGSSALEIKKPSVASGV